MADIKTTIETALAVAGPGYVLFRRVFYGISYAAGSFIAAQQERSVTEKEAYEIGRLHVIKTLADFFALKWAAINWAAVGAGLDQASRNLGMHARVAWKGLKRDARLVRDFVLHKKAEKPHETVQILNEAIKADEPVVETRALIGIQRRIGVLVQRGEARTDDETHELGHLRQHLASYESGVVEEAEGTAPKMQGLLSIPAAPVLTPVLWRWAIAATVTTFAFAGLWRFSEAEKTPLKMKLTQAETQVKEFAAERDGWKASYEVEKQAVQQAHAQATQIAKTIEAERRDTAAAAARDRRRAREIQDVISGIGAAPSWSLRIDQPAEIAPTPDPTAPTDPSGVPPVASAAAGNGSAGDALGSHEP